MLNVSDVNSAFYWRSISAFGYCFFIGYWLNFTMLLYRPSAKKNNVLINLLTYIPSTIFWVGNLLSSRSESLSLEYYGWIDMSPANINQFMYNTWCLVVYIVGSIALFLEYKTSTNNREKKQIKIILVTSILGFSMGITSDVIFPIFNINLFPFGVIFVAIGMFGSYYAINKHRMMITAPKLIPEYIFNTVNEPIFILSKDFTIQNCNNISLNIIGFTHEEISNKQFTTFIKYKDFDFNSIMEKGYVKNIEIELKKRYGDFISCELSGTVIYDEYNDILGIIILLHDISERKKISEIEKNYTSKLEETNKILKNEIKDRIKAEEKMHYFVYYDALTGLPNRKKVLEDINTLIKNENEIFAVLFIDLDGFKSINDNFGHQVGDSVLKTVAIRLKKVIGTNDVVSRIGGDEFIIILGKISSKLYIEEIADKIQKTLKKPIIHNDNNLFVGASIGVSIFPEHGINSDSLIKNADIAMYEVKKNGGYGYAIYSSKMSDKVIDKLKMKLKLHEAMLNNEFITYYQPIMDLKSMKVSNAEGLIRWKQGDRIVPPMEFIPIAKNVGEILTLDNWMIENSCTQCKVWHHLGLKNFHVSVNTSYTQLKQPDFISFVENTLETISLPAECLTLEITEDEAMEAPEIIIDILNKLKNIGIQISLDDFGTGYSSFSYINRLPIDKLKIDRSLIMNLQDDYKNIMIVKAIIMMAHSLDIKIVAEGIETEEQLNTLKELNCDYIQGYLIGKPMDAIEFEKKFIH